MIGEIIVKILNRFPVIRKNKLFDFSKSVIIPFILKTISKLFKDKIDEKLIILGAYGGGAFVDNTKYLFKFLVKKTDYKVIWVTKFNEVASEIRNLGGKVIPFWNINTMRLLRHAKYIFMTHGFIDVMTIEFSPKTTVFLTWHGTPIKKINTSVENSYRYRKWNRIFRLKLREDEYIDYLLTAAEGNYEHKILSSAFKLLPRKIVTLGYPRNDILFNRKENFINDIKKRYEIPLKINRIFIYAPTWRENLTFKFPLSKNELNILNNLLINTKSLLLIKAHMFEQKIDFESYKNIKLVGKKSDLQELLVISDVLITDYSSVMIDYLLTMKPILLFTYDLEDYIRERGFYYHFQDIAPGPLLFNGAELIDAIVNIEKITSEYEEVRRNLCNKFNKYIDDKSTERVLDFLNLEYK